jgi:hypothetical protein
VKPAIAKITRRHLFVFFLGLLLALSAGSLAWLESADHYQRCSGNCEGNERLAAFSHDKTFDDPAVSSTPTDRISELQSVNLGGSSDLRAATAGSMLSHADTGPSGGEGLKNPSGERASTPGPLFFLLIGSALIGIRLLIGYRSRKVKHLATGTQ